MLIAMTLSAALAADADYGGQGACTAFGISEQTASDSGSYLAFGTMGSDHPAALGGAELLNEYSRGCPWVRVNPSALDADVRDLFEKALSGIKPRRHTVKVVGSDDLVVDGLRAAFPALEVLRVDGDPDDPIWLVVYQDLPAPSPDPWPPSPPDPPDPPGTSWSWGAGNGADSWLRLTAGYGRANAHHWSHFGLLGSLDPTLIEGAPGWMDAAELVLFGHAQRATQPVYVRPGVSVETLARLGGALRFSVPREGVSPLLDLGGFVQPGVSAGPWIGAGVRLGPVNLLVHGPVTVHDVLGHYGVWATAEFAVVGRGGR